VSFHLTDLLAALALFFVLEGMMPFLNPGGVRRLIEKLLELGDRELRIAGLVSMLFGVTLLYFVR
jgi:hypothetical protein